MAPRKNAQSTAAELSLVHLENCFVNLPPTLVSLLVNVNTVSGSPACHQEEIVSIDQNAIACAKCHRRT